MDRQSCSGDEDEVSFHQNFVNLKSENGSLTKYSPEKHYSMRATLTDHEGTNKDLSDEEDTEQPKKCATETGSQIARSIISNIFKRIDTRSSQVEENTTNDDVRVLGDQTFTSETSDGLLDDSMDAEIQSPRTTARISEWLNNIHSNGSRPKASLSILDSFSNFDSEDDQPPGFSSPLRSGGIAVRGYESPSIDSFETSTYMDSPTRVQGFTHSSLLQRKLPRAYDFDFPMHFKDEKGSTPKNRYMKIVEKTSQRLRRGEDGLHTLHTVHTLEKSEKSLDPMCSSSFLMLVVGLVLLLILLNLVGFLPLYHQCGSAIKVISNSTSVRAAGV